jgi:hypothetical protein
MDHLDSLGILELRESVETMGSLVSLACLGQKETPDIQERLVWMGSQGTEDWEAGLELLGLRGLRI